MDFEISIPVYCHDLINPPSQDRNCDIRLDVTNGTLIQFVREGPTHAGTRYLLKIPHAKSTGFTSYEQHIFNYEIINLILAFNLSLERVCMTSRSSEFSQHSVTPEKTLPSSNVTRTNNIVFVGIIEESVTIREDVHVTVTHSAK